MGVQFFVLFLSNLAKVTLNYVCWRL